MQSRIRRPLNLSASVTHAHCILGSSRKTSIEKESLAQTWNVMQIVKFLKFQLGIISLDSEDPQILEMCKKCRRPCHWTIYQELCQLIIRVVQSLLCWIMWRSLIRRLSLHLCRPMKYYRNYLINL